MPTTQVTLQMLEGVASDLRKTGATFDPATTYVGLATAVVNNGVNTVLSNLTEATYTGYARALGSPWAGPYQLNTGSTYFQGVMNKFVGPSDDSGENIVAFFLVDAETAGDLLYFVVLDTPVGLFSTLDALDVMLRIEQDAAANWDASIIANG